MSRFLSIFWLTLAGVVFPQMVSAQELGVAPSAVQSTQSAARTTRRREVVLESMSDILARANGPVSQNVTLRSGATTIIDAVGPIRVTCSTDPVPTTEGAYKCRSYCFCDGIKNRGETMETFGDTAKDAFKILALTCLNACHEAGYSGSELITGFGRMNGTPLEFPLGTPSARNSCWKTK